GRVARATRDSQTGDAAKICPGRQRRDRRQSDWRVSHSHAGWLAAHRKNSVAAIRSVRPTPQLFLTWRRSAVPARFGRRICKTCGEIPMKTLTVISPGLLTTVQDLGREGFGAIGVSASGAADALALRLGNKLLGNPERAAAVEMTLLGGSFQFSDEAWV